MNAWPKKNSALVLDNCMIHHAADLQHLFDIKGTFSALVQLVLNTKVYPGSLLIFLPPYSPDYNPIELSFHVSK